jgi:hypothetical protein
MKRLAVLMLGCVLVTAAPALAGAGDTRHSGRVLAVDPAAGTLRIEEMRAWTGPNTGTVELPLRLAPDATIRMVSRAATIDAARWPNAWEERPIALDALKPGDFVTVTTGERDEVAVALEVVRPEP